MQPHHAGFGLLAVMHGNRELAHLHRGQQGFEKIGIHVGSVEGDAWDHFDDIENPAEIGRRGCARRQTGSEIGNGAGRSRKLPADAFRSACRDVFEFGEHASSLR